MNNMFVSRNKALIGCLQTKLTSRLTCQILESLRSKAALGNCLWGHQSDGVLRKTGLLYLNSTEVHILFGAALLSFEWQALPAKIPALIYTTMNDTAGALPSTQSAQPRDQFCNYLNLVFCNSLKKETFPCCPPGFCFPPCCVVSHPRVWRPSVVCPGNTPCLQSGARADTYAQLDVQGICFCVVRLLLLSPLACRKRKRSRTKNVTHSCHFHRQAWVSDPRDFTGKWQASFFHPWWPKSCNTMHHKIPLKQMAIVIRFSEQVRQSRVMHLTRAAPLSGDDGGWGEESI